MKRLSTIMLCLFAMMAASLSAKAQEVTITLFPGCTWISYPGAEVMDVATALGDFVPAEGDIIKSQYSSSIYRNGYWMGGVTHFIPGMGYKYYSNRTEVVSFVFGETGTLPMVTTATPTGITTYGMTCGGEVTETGSSGVLVRGVCWSTQQNPTINDSHTTDGYGIGSFSSLVDGLEMNTMYYVRAYAMSTTGTGYGEQMMFSTKNGVPMLTTSAASEIGPTWAACGGDVNDDGGMEVTERGICWSTSPNPTIEDSYSSDGAGLGGFTVYMYNLQSNTTYYVRAYAINSYTTAYGNEVSFTTLESDSVPAGAINGKFTINANGDQVYFSQGNLQYQASTNTWRFAENQQDYIGWDNSNISPTYDGWIDLFGWGTSGWDNGNLYYQPYNTENNYDPYTGYGYGPIDGTNFSIDLTGAYANADWGVYNAISNGGNMPGLWRSLIGDEWYYLFFNRSTPSGIRFAKAKVNGVNGVILLPDSWNISVYVLNYTNLSQAPFTANEIMLDDWQVMETNGAVFFPVTGGRNGTSLFNVGSEGGYWSASDNGSAAHRGVRFDNSNLYADSNGYYNEYGYYGWAVRLAHDIE